jgi:hypothetical protein
MPSQSPELTLTDPIQIQRASATNQAFLQLSSCPDHTKNAWLYIKNALQNLGATISTHMTLALDKISKQLTVLEKKIAAQPAALLKPSTYADHARLSPSQVFHEKPVLSRALREVTVKVVDDSKPIQTSGRLVESINAVRSTKANKVVAARKLESGDIVITADNEVMKNLIEQEEGWTKVIARKTKVKALRFTVIAFRVRTNRIETTNQKRAVADLHS